ncbi:MAG: hypothetical protein GX100_04215 [candidate division WS1 bacterium]|nr:hypothetical protein [candidate division WS1 bacterium]
MTSQERVLTALKHEEPDRVPFNLRPGQLHVERLRAETGSADFAEHFHHDLRYVTLDLPAPPEEVSPQEWTPVPSDGEVARAAEQTAALQAQGVAVCSSYVCGVYEQAKEWIGDEGTMIGPYEDPAGLAEMLDRITDWKMALYGAYVRAGVDLVWIGDDLGAQRSLVMSPRQYREWYRPRHARIVSHLRRLRPEIRIVFHCCGHATPLIRDLIEVDIDVLEAVQPEAMDLSQLKREFGRDLTFWGGIGTQGLMQGSPERIRDTIRETLRLMAPGGGYLAAPCHTLTEDVPWENVLAFHQALEDHGAYPNPAA